MVLLNMYSVSHFLIWLTAGRYFLKSWQIFFLLSVSWELLELILPYEFAVEEWGNKVMDIVVNTLGFLVGTRLRTDGLVAQISKTTSQNHPGP